MRKPLIAGNWKMNTSLSESKELASAIAKTFSQTHECDVLLLPPYVNLESVRHHVLNTPILLGAQNLHFEDKGAFTGEISGQMLRNIGCGYVLVGHSERRQFFGDTDEWVNKKIRASLRNLLFPIVCVGETLSQRERKQTFSVISNQLHTAFSDINEKEIPQCVIAYEPVWAIGTGNTASPAEAQEVHVSIRQWFSRHYNDAFASRVRILYGGSVTAHTIADLMAEPDLDGALVGGSSLKVNEFIEIVKKTIHIKSSKGV